MGKRTAAHKLMSFIIVVVLLSISLPIVFQLGIYGNFEYSKITLFVGISIGISIMLLISLISSLYSELKSD